MMAENTTLTTQAPQTLDEQWEAIAGELGTPESKYGWAKREVESYAMELLEAIQNDQPLPWRVYECPDVYDRTQRQVYTTLSKAINHARKEGKRYAYYMRVRTSAKLPNKVYLWPMEHKQVTE